MQALSELPMVSLPLPWQGDEWTRLTSQLAEGRLPHALLLAGREHIGKAHLALALSRLLLCVHPEGLLNCGRCHPCELSARGNHGDFRWVRPNDDSRIIKIDQIRDVVRFTSTKAGLGSRKVIVIAPADRMNVNAFNALLKSLEEPANDTYLILLCNQMQGIPATIRSRCQLLRVATPSMEVSLRWLDQITSDSTLSRSLLAIAGGRPLLAQKLYLDDIAEGYSMKQLALESLAASRISVPEAAQLWSKDETGEFLEFLAADLQLRIGTLSAKKMKRKQLRGIFDLLDEVYRLHRSIISGANPNKQLLYISFLSKYQRQLGTGIPGDNILARNGGVRS